MKEAMLYEQRENGKTACMLCAHRCVIPEGKRGICGVRENRDGKLFTKVYGRTIAQQVDPIEKKPFYHFDPGSKAYSIAAPGCNFRCRWCQNCEISQTPSDQHFRLGVEASPGEIVECAIASRCTSICYTYTEPTIFFEYSYDTAKAAHQRGLRNAYVTNGYMTEEMLDVFDGLLDAATVDLKGFRDDMYRKYTGAKLQPVLDALKSMKRRGIWVEVTTLIVTGVNDDPAEIRDAAEFVVNELGPETPWHLSRFYPAYLMSDVPPTPVSTLKKAEEIGRAAGLDYVYLGNVGDGSVTNCRKCGETLIRRAGYGLTENRIGREGNCMVCGAKVPGIDMQGRQSGVSGPT